MASAMTSPTFSEHARLRMAAMGVSTRRVRRVIRRPEVERPGSYQYKDRRLFIGDGIGVVVDLEENTVVTVIWDTREEYVRPQRYVEAS